MRAILLGALALAITGSSCGPDVGAAFLRRHAPDAVLIPQKPYTFGSFDILAPPGGEVWAMDFPGGSGFYFTAAIVDLTAVPEGVVMDCRDLTHLVDPAGANGCPYPPYRPHAWTCEFDALPPWTLRGKHIPVPQLQIVDEAACDPQPPPFEDRPCQQHTLHVWLHESASPTADPPKPGHHDSWGWWNSHGAMGCLSASEQLWFAHVPNGPIPHPYTGLRSLEVF